MKKIILTLIILLAAPSAFAQSNDSEPHKQERKKVLFEYNYKTFSGVQRKHKYRILQGYEVDEHGNPYTSHWSGFGFSFVNMPALSASGKALADVVDMRRSFRYDLGFFDLKRIVPQYGITIVTGLGIQFNSIHFNRGEGTYLYNDNQNILHVTHAPNPSDVKNARLGVTYLTMPWLVEKAFLMQNVRDPFFVNIGVELKLRTKQSAKSWWDNEEHDGLMVNSRKPGFKLFTYELKAQIGWRNIGLVGSWTPTSILRNEVESKNSIWTVGLKLYTSQR